MKYKKLMPWARNLAVLSAIIALIATVYALGAATPQEALASSHVEYVYSDWGPKPNGVSGGDQFRLIFLSSTERKPNSTNIADYNTIRPRRRRSRPHRHPAIRRRFQRRRLHGTMPGCRRTGQHGDHVHQRQQPGLPIYWLKGNKVADNYQDFYNGDWDDEANDKTELGNNGPRYLTGAPTTRRPAAKTTAPRHPSAETSRLWAILKFA